MPGRHSNNDMSVLHEKNKHRGAHTGAAAPHTRHRIHNVLVVDDSADAAQSLVELLTRWGYHVTVAHDGPAALAATQDTLPDIALLDIDLPAMDGYELAAHLRFQPGCEELPIVAITGAATPEEVRQSFARGFAAHLSKPVSASVLRELLRQGPG